MRIRRSRLAAASTCVRCGTEGPLARTYSDTVDFKGLTLDVQGLACMNCKKCGYEWVSDEQRELNLSIMKTAYAVRRDELRAELGLLSSEEIAQLRHYLAMNQAEASALFGGGPKAFNKYESGEVLQSQAMDKLMRLLWNFGQPALTFLRTYKNLPVGPAITAILPEHEVLERRVLSKAMGPGNRVVRSNSITDFGPFPILKNAKSLNRPQMIRGGSR